MADLISITAPKKVKRAKSATLTTTPLKNVRYTGALMMKLAIRYQNDIAMHAHLSFSQFFDLIKNIPYKTDPKEMEFLQRPYYTLNQRGKGGDCDDKAICIGAYCAAAKIPFRFVALGRSANGRLHHVVVEVKINNKWFHIDATYSYCVLGSPMYSYARRMVISDIYPKEI